MTAADNSRQSVASEGGRLVADALASAILDLAEALQTDAPAAEGPPAAASATAPPARAPGEGGRSLASLTSRAVSDAAMGEIGPQLAYKSTRYGGNLVVADRWFASSQIHHGCHQPDGTPCRLIGKNRIDKQLVCPLTGEIVDRDHNAARNLRDWPDMPVDAQSVCRPRPSAVPAAAPETAAQTIGETDGLGSSRKTIPHRKAASDEARTGTRQRGKELRKESA